MTQGMRYALFCAAYTAYCEDKKDLVKENVREITEHNLANPNNMRDVETDPNVKYAFRRFDNETAFNRFSQTGEKVLRGYIQQDIVDLMSKYIYSSKTKFWRLVAVNFVTTLIAAFLVALVPILATLLGYEGAIRLLNQLGQYLTHTFPLPVDHPL